MLTTLEVGDFPLSSASYSLSIVHVFSRFISVIDDSGVFPAGVYV